MQVLGFSKGPPAGSFAVPFSHSFSGGAVGAELSLAAQRHEYCEGHRRRRAAAAELMSEPLPPLVPAPSELLVHCGVFSPASSLCNAPASCIVAFGACHILQKQTLHWLLVRSRGRCLCLGSPFLRCILLRVEWSGHQPCVVELPTYAFAIVMSRATSAAT